MIVTDLPLDEATREDLRAVLIDEYLIQGYLKAMNHRRSLRCAKGDHKCHNTGISCLCRCHDRQPLFEEVR